MQQANPGPFERVRSLSKGPHLAWDCALGVGFLDSNVLDENVYNDEYFQEYVRRGGSLTGQKLNEARYKLVQKHYPRGGLVDVGIGAGSFCQYRNRQGQLTRGYDVNPKGIEWLKVNELWANLYQERVEAISLWDVLEHVAYPELLLDQVRGYVFTSLPIFRDWEHVFTSKHYKPGEHLWYFTRDGLTHAMDESGWACVELNNMESKLGREDVWSFVFRRKR